MTSPRAKTDQQLCKEARAIWQAGVDAVRSETLVANAVHREGDKLTVCGHEFNTHDLDRIAVVGAGKAGAGMAAAIEEALGNDVVEEKLVGWVNVPADCLRQLKKIHLHAGRPAGVNEPVAEGVAGSEEILKIVGDLTQRDLCLVLISGGGSALLPSPKPPLTLQDKQEATRFLMHSGAAIQELNTVRKRLSQIKGGGLARASQAGQLISLIISDIVGDPLDMIASGPTMPDQTTDRQALDVLSRYHADAADLSQVIKFLEESAESGSRPPAFPQNVHNHIIGNNQVAVSAAMQRANDLGYHVISLGSDSCGEASSEGRDLAQRCRQLRDDSLSQKPICILSGGEPVVHLTPTDRPRKGGRNQELVLAGMESLIEDGMQRIVLLSGGTDGEDGPTDAAGAVADGNLLREVMASELNMRSFLEINDSYTFFQAVGGLLVTGPTHTNVMDLRVALIGD